MMTRVLYFFQDTRCFLSLGTMGLVMGGVALFLNEAIISNSIFKSYPIEDKLMEALFVQATVAGKSIIIGAIYKPPNVDLPSFNNAFGNLLAALVLLPLRRL